MKSDIEIAKEAKMLPVSEIAAKANIKEEYLEYYGNYKAKVSLKALDSADKSGKLVLVTAVSPTPAGEGKTTVTVGLTQAMNRLGKNCAAALREPSMGPVMGIKGGAAGGGYSQVLPMEDINLHFTGDLHAITAAHNLLCAVLDNHIHQGNELDIDLHSITIKRVMDMNDRALRNTIIGLGGKLNGVPREDGFMISVASEVMAILCLSNSLADLKEKLASMVIAYNKAGQPVTVRDLNVQGAMAALLKDAVKPNLVQTLENTPVFIHGGPFANIAHGCNSILATKMAASLFDYTITEAGFGSDLGAEKFLDIKCRKGGLAPDAIVIVATIRALMYNGGVPKAELEKTNLEALKRGFANLKRHIQNMKKYGVGVVVAINRFYTDEECEIDTVKSLCAQMDTPCETAEVFAKGGEGGITLAERVCEIIEKGESAYHPLYDTNLPLKEKIETVVREIYGGKGVEYSKKADKALAKITELGYGNLPVCIAKTQYSFSDNPALLGCPEGFTVTIRDVTLSAGAGFVVALAGEIMTMPGLGKTPAATKIDIDENGEIYGLF